MQNIVGMDAPLSLGKREEGVCDVLRLVQYEYLYFVSVSLLTKPNYVCPEDETCPCEGRGRGIHTSIITALLFIYFAIASCCTSKMVRATPALLALSLSILFAHHRESGAK